MEQKIFNGKPILFSNDGSITFWEEIFFMLDAYRGSACCMCADPELALHFEAIKKRLAALTKSDICAQYITLGLGDK